MPQIESVSRVAVFASSLWAEARLAPPQARAAGFSGLLFDAFSPTLSIPDLSQTGRRDFRHLLSAHDQQLVGLRADLGGTGFGPGADIDRLLFRLDRALEAAAGLAAPTLCVDLGPLAEPRVATVPRPAITAEQAGLLILPTTQPLPVEAPPPPPSESDLALESMTLSALTELGARADRYSVTVALSSSLSSLAALQQALTAARCPWFGVEFDPVALLSDRWQADEYFSRLGSLIRHVRARDALVGTDRRTRPTPIGRGSVAWQTVLGHLHASGYHGWLTVDPTELPDRASAARSGLELLAPLVHE